MKNFNQMKVSKKEKQMQICHPNAAGIDIGATKHYVAALPGIAEEKVRSFGCFTRDLYELLQWLRECKVDAVAMESTSIYWAPLF
jgi:transposase